MQPLPLNYKMIYSTSTSVQFPDLKLLIFTQLLLQIYSHGIPFSLKGTMHFLYQTDFFFLMQHFIITYYYYTSESVVPSCKYELISICSLNSLEQQHGWEQVQFPLKGFQIEPACPCVCVRSVAFWVASAGHVRWRMEVRPQNLSLQLCL